MSREGITDTYVSSSIAVIKPEYLAYLDFAGADPIRLWTGNKDTVFTDFSGYQNVWRPTYEKAPSLSWPDVITVFIAHYPSYQVDHYWEMDFWREIIHGW